MSSEQSVFVVDAGYKLGNWMYDVAGFRDVSSVQLGNYKQITGKIKHNDILVLEGGVDIDPLLYGQRPHPMTQMHDQMRDHVEKALFNVAMKVGARVLGICRGAQLTTVLAGGSLYQHVEGHDREHSIIAHLSPGGEQQIFKIKSVHHQMMNLATLPEHKYDLLGWSEHPQSYVYYEGPDSDPHTSIPLKEPEIVWFPHIKALCIQGHPEWEQRNSKATEFYRSLVHMYLKVES